MVLRGGSHRPPPPGFGGWKAALVAVLFIAAAFLYAHVTR